MTNEPCLHIEFRMTGTPALRRNGFLSNANLLFDHRAFWQPRLRFYEFDLSKLGRLVHNMQTRKRGQTGSRRRGPWLDRHGFDQDLIIGAITFRSSSVQQVLDDYPAARSYLRELDMSHWLPASSGKAPTHIYD